MTDGIVKLQKKTPGEAGLWVFILGDMAMFMLFFAIFLYYRAGDPESFELGQMSANKYLGALNTIVLLTSSLFVVRAISAVHIAKMEMAHSNFYKAIGCGIIFVCVKLFEYFQKLSSGIHFADNDYYMYYFILTGTHFLHVLTGLAILLYLMKKSKQAAPTQSDIRTYEGGGIYWHMVDLLWIVIFPLFYLVQ